MQYKYVDIRSYISETRTQQCLQSEHINLKLIIKIENDMRLITFMLHCASGMG